MEIRSSEEKLATGLGWASLGLGTGQRRTGLWARAAGDAKDLALLGIAAARKRENGARLSAATAGIAAIAALDAYVAARLTGSSGVAAATAPQPADGGAGEPPPDDLSKDPAYEPPEPLKGIKGG